MRVLVLVAFIATLIVPALSGSASAQPADAGAAVANQAPKPEVIGAEKKIDKRLDGRTSKTRIKHAGATYIKVHFSELKLAAGDQVTVARPDGQEKRTYTASGEDTWAMSVQGSEAVVALKNKSGNSAAVVDRFARGFNEDELKRRADANPMSICGSLDYKDAVCYQSSHPTHYAKGAAVVRLLIGGTTGCTGWRAGPDNRVFTNNHCFSTTSEARNTEVQFNYDCPTCGGSGNEPVTKVNGDTVLATDGGLDYTIFTVQNFSTIESFGYLEIDARAPQIGETIYIAGHPRLLTKKFSIESDVNNGDCKAEAISGVDMGYRCDTEGGSSGSPVLSADHKVIGLHHLGGCPSGRNWGVRMELINAEVSHLI